MTRVCLTWALDPFRMGRSFQRTEIIARDTSKIGTCIPDGSRWTETDGFPWIKHKSGEGGGSLVLGALHAHHHTPKRVCAAGENMRLFLFQCPSRLFEFTKIQAKRVAAREYLPGYKCATKAEKLQKQNNRKTDVVKQITLYRDPDDWLCHHAWYKLIVCGYRHSTYCKSGRANFPRFRFSVTDAGRLGDGRYHTGVLFWIKNHILLTALKLIAFKCA